MRPNVLLPPSTREKEFHFSAREFDHLRKKANAHSGIRASADKYEMYYARLVKRLRARGLKSFSEYLALIEREPREFVAFINAITTNVTSFDREGHHFQFLREQVQQRQIKSLKVWSAGCSSGEEAYSIIVNLHQLTQDYQVPIDITGTDLDTDVLERACRGIYDLEAIEKYSKDIKRRFFDKGIGKNVGKCRVKARYRNLVNFYQLNLIKPWQFKEPFDVIFCRNVMIYFNGDIKQRMLEKFASHLVPDGLLFLGHSESISKTNSQFDNIGNTIFRKR